MDVAKIALDQEKAQELYQKYRLHQHYETDMDREIKRAYKEIARGKVVIQAIESIKRAGVDAKGLPKLALASAMASHCWIERKANGSLTMRDREQEWSRGKRKLIADFHAAEFTFPPESFPIQLAWDKDPSKRYKYRANASQHKAAMPIIPIHLRPKRGLQNYHVLWEAEWEPIPPRDPYLLRRIGTADLWLVCAAWDLTDVEMAAMATRVRGN